MKSRKSKYLTSERMQKMLSSPGIVHKRKLAAAVFDSLAYKAHTRKKKAALQRRFDSVALVKGTRSVKLTLTKRKPSTSAKAQRPQTA